MKKKLFLLTALPLLMGSLTGCGEDSSGVKIGILTLGFEAVDVAADGFLDELTKAGISYNAIKRIPSDDSDRSVQALDLASQCSYLLGLGTDNSKSLKAAVEGKGKAETTTLFFTAVTDPVAEGLVPSNDNGSGFVCGTTDMNPVAEQIELIKECIPSVDKVGIFYTASENNSVIQANMAIEVLNTKGIAPVVKTCMGPTDISSNIIELAGTEGLDAIYIPTDNNIAKNGTVAVSQAVEGKNILVVCGEEGMLKDCGAITLSINYENLGRLTGKMAVQVIKGEKKAKDIPVGSLPLEELEYVMSLNNASKAGVTIPESVQNKCRNIDPKEDAE